MSLSDHYVDVAAPSGCKTCKWYSELDDGDRRFFDDKAAADGKLMVLYRACRAAGLEVNETNFRHHMRDHYGSR